MCMGCYEMLTYLQLKFEKQVYAKWILKEMGIWKNQGYEEIDGGEFPSQVPAVM